MRPPRIAGRLVLVFLASLLACSPSSAAEPPADAFCVILIEPSADFTMIRVLVDENTSLEERAALWPSVDLDRNGVITPTEKEAFRWSQTKVFADEAELDFKAITLWPSAPYTTANKQKALYATTWRQVGHVFHHQEYKLPDRLSTASELETQEVREFGFDLEAWRFSRFVVSGGRNLSAENLSAAPTHYDQPKPVIEYVVVRAPENWIVDRIEGYSYQGPFVLRPGEKEVDVPAFDTKRPYNVTFLNPDLEEKMAKIDGVPAPGLIGLIAVGLVVWIRARRA